MSHDPIPGTGAINLTYADDRKTKLKNWGNKERLKSESEYSLKKVLESIFYVFKIYYLRQVSKKCDLCRKKSN